MKLKRDMSASTASANTTRGHNGARAVDRSKTSAKTAMSTSARHLILASINIPILIAALIVAGMLVYPALSNWWQVRRDNQILAAENTALGERNQQIESLIAALGTPQGIENRAREQFGWVLAGEHAVNIIGLEGLSSSTTIPPSIAPGSVQPGIDWLTDTIDFLLDYQPPAPSQSAEDTLLW